MRFRTWVCEAWLRILSFLVGEVVPVLSFGGVVAFRRTPTFLELTVFGYGALVLIGLLLLRRGRAWVEGMPHGLRRGLLCSLFTAVLWLAVFGVLTFGLHMMQKLYTWWIFVGVCFFIGRVFALLDEVKQSGGEADETDTT